MSECAPCQRAKGTTTTFSKPVSQATTAVTCPIGYTKIVLQRPHAGQPAGATVCVPNEQVSSYS